MDGEAQTYDCRNAFLSGYIINSPQLDASASIMAEDLFLLLIVTHLSAVMIDRIFLSKFDQSTCVLGQGICHNRVMRGIWFAMSLLGVYRFLSLVSFVVVA